MIAAVTTTTSGPYFVVHGWLAFVIIAGIIVAAILSIYKFVWPILRKAVHVVDIWPGVELLAPSAPTIIAISEQFKNNGGKSMRDAIDENTRITKETRSLVTGILHRVEALEKKA